MPPFVAKETTKEASDRPLESIRQPSGPFWTRWPKGWIILGLFVLAWVGVYLVWNGVALMLGL